MLILDNAYKIKTADTHMFSTICIKNIGNNN